MNQKKFISLILVAGGRGSRFGASTPKQFLPFNGKAIVRYSLELFDAMEEISEIIAVTDPAYFSHFEGTQKKILFAEPGQQRWNSVQNGFQKCSLHADLILTHDAARPFIDRQTVLAVIEAALRVGAAAPGTAIVNTVKQCTKSKIVEKTVDRSLLWEVQTPQALKPELFRQGLALVAEKNLPITDDLSLVELLNEPAEIVPAPSRNFKITTPFDWKLAEFLYSFHLQDLDIPRRRPRFESGVDGDEAAKLKKFSDADGLKACGCGDTKKQVCAANWPEGSDAGRSGLSGGMSICATN